MYLTKNFFQFIIKIRKERWFNMTKNPQQYFSSDFHFNHGDENRGIITFERRQFKTIQEHDNYIINLVTSWSQKWAPGSTFWNLGDWGDTNYLWVINLLRDAGITCNFIYGNHDSREDINLFKQYFDNVYEYPIFISQKLVLSHFPVAVYYDTINVHGHTHSSDLQDINHVNANIHVADYKPISEQYLASIFGRIPKFTRRFLYEPFAKDYHFTQPKEDVIMDRNGNIDLSASRLMQKLNKEKRGSDDSYQPYAGEFQK
jgi:calcineurin-like phosphoesterase family protein